MFVLNYCLLCKIKHYRLKPYSILWWEHKELNAIKILRLNGTLKDTGFYRYINAPQNKKITNCWNLFFTSRCCDCFEGRGICKIWIIDVLKCLFVAKIMFINFSVRNFDSPFLPHKVEPLSKWFKMSYTFKLLCCIAKWDWRIYCITWITYIRQFKSL